MMSFLNKRHIGHRADGKEEVFVVISVGSSSDLPANGIYEDLAFVQGSVAWNINSGDWFGLVNGNWVKQPQPIDLGLFEGV